MIKRISVPLFKIALFSCLSLTTSWSKNTPPNKVPLDYRFNTNIFLKRDSNQYALFTSVQQNQVLNDSKSFAFSFRKNLSDGLKLILEASRTYGLRHNEDWNLNRDSSLWTWEDTSQRGENIVSGGVQYKYSDPTWVSSALKFRFLYVTNLYNDQINLLSRVGYLTVMTDELVGLLQFDLQIPVNYSRYSYNEWWLYWGQSYFLEKNVSIGYQASLGQFRWHESDFFLGRTKNSYDNTVTSFRLGLLINLYF